MIQKYKYEGESKCRLRQTGGLAVYNVDAITSSLLDAISGSLLV